MSYNPNFSWKRKTVTITKGTDLPAGYQAKLTIVRSTDAPEAQADFRDLRFETTDGYGLPYWIESIVSVTATVWVKLKDALTSASVNIYMYYGDPYVSSASNGTNTFDFFDDFDSYPDGNLNGLGGWTGNTDYKVQSVIAYKGKAIRSTLAIADVISHSITPIDKGIFSVYMRLDSYESMSTYLSSGATKTYEVALYANPANVTYLSTTNPVTNFSPSVPRNYNQWYKIDIAFDTVADQYAYIKVDDSIKVTNTATISGGNIDKITLARGGTAAGCNWDIVVLRKYVATEPSTPTFSGLTTVNWNPQRKPITINNASGSSLTDYQVKLTIPFAQEMNNDFSDLRFVSSSNVPLSYWLESSTPGQTADIWIKTNLATGANTIYTHYGNPNLTSLSSGTNTFDFFDDFSGDLSKWVVTQSTAGNVQIVGREIRILGNNVWSNNGISSVAVINRPIIIEWNSRVTATDQATFEGHSETFVPAQGILFERIGAGTYNRRLNDASSSSWGTVDLSTTKLKIVLPTANGMSMYWNDSLKETNGTWTTATNSKLRFQVYRSTSYQFVSNIRTRKYVATEPTIDYTANPVAMNTFSNRKTLTINNNSGGVLTDYQVPVTVTYVATMQANFNDISFVDSSGNLLPYWIESKTDSTTAKFWIKVNLPLYGSSPTGDNIVYMYYGNANLTSASDGVATFISFLDFENSVNGFLAGTSVTTQHYSGSYSYYPSSGYNINLVTQPTKPYIITFFIYKLSSPATDQIQLGNPTQTVVIGYTGDNTWHYYYDSWTSFSPSVAVNYNVWTRFDVVMKSSNYDVIINNNVAGSNIAYQSGGINDGAGHSGDGYATYPASGYFDAWHTRKYIANESTAITVSTGSEESTGSINFVSTPVGARIWLGSPLVDQGAINVTPYIVTGLMPGTYDYKLVLSGYADLTGTADVSSGVQTNKTLTFLGSIYVTSTPSPSRIWIGGVDQLVSTPATITGLTAGSHSYYLVYAGRDNTPGNFTAMNGQTVNVPVTLLTPANIGALSMTITPRETPCRTGICTTDVSVTWKNTGESIGSFIPSINVGSGTVAPVYTSENLAANAEIIHTFTVSNMSVGINSICPNPN